MAGKSAFHVIVNLLYLERAAKIDPTLFHSAGHAIDRLDSKHYLTPYTRIPLKRCGRATRCLNGKTGTIYHEGI
jgi:hypothetical protein